MKEKTGNFFTIYAGLLLFFIFPICFGIALGWRWGLFFMPIFHFAWCLLKIMENNNDGNNNQKS